MEPKGNAAGMLTALDTIVNGIVMGKRCQWLTIVQMAGDPTKGDGRINGVAR